MNWYKKSQAVHDIERLKYLVDTDEANKWAEDDLENKQDQYHHEKFKENIDERRRSERPDLYRVEKGQGVRAILRPWQKSPPNTPLKNEQEIEKEVIEQEKWTNEFFGKHGINIEYIKRVDVHNAKVDNYYLKSNYEKFKEQLERILSLAPNNHDEVISKNKKVKQYQNKINDILNRINHNKKLIEVFQQASTQSQQAIIP